MEPGLRPYRLRRGESDPKAVADFIGDADDGQPGLVDGIAAETHAMTDGIFAGKYCVTNRRLTTATGRVSGVSEAVNPRPATIGMWN